LLRLAHQLSDIRLHPGILPDRLDRFRLYDGAKTVAHRLHIGITFERQPRLFEPLVAHLLLAARRCVESLGTNLELKPHGRACQAGERLRKAILQLARTKRLGAGI